ncbi:MAG: hypothetical protein DWH80_01410 [Planctomycetota bacterium]|nr:MAG: hypothetical protein DWH80_01410 [Planctomycetota bacterium]
MRRSWLLSIVCSAVCCLLLDPATAQESAHPVPKAGEFPPPNTGTYLAGELVIIDPVNRRGGLRLDGNEPHDRYHSGPLHYFAMLPYGMLSFNGAPAELRDIPLGTHVHGYFYLPPVGEEATIPPLPKDMERYEIKQNHAVSLEDDFSFYQRRGQSWKVVSIDSKKGKIHVAPAGQMAQDGINTPSTFDIDDLTKVWKGHTLVELTDIAPDQIVQFNLGWSPGWRDREFTVSELWLDDESRKFATDLQRRRHVKYQKQRWLPGWIDSVEDNDYGGGIITLTLFGGMDPSLYAELKATQDKGFGVAVAEKSLRTWFHRSDKKIGQVIEWKESENPPSGSSGIQVRMKFTELLDGYRPGRVVRVKCHDWLFVTMPSEERVKTMEEQQRSTLFRLP